MPKVKCPRCGSTNTLPIVYGMPPYKLYEAEQRGELVLGGCCFAIDASPMRACASCKYQFRSGRLASLLLSDEFVSLEFNIGGYFGINHRMLIQRDGGGYFLKYGRSWLCPDFEELEKGNFDQSPDQAYFKRSLTQLEWQKLALKLDRCEIIEWKRKYYNNDILDGTQWSIEIKVKGMRKISIYGSNEYPQYWNNFMNLLRREVDTSIC